MRPFTPSRRPVARAGFTLVELLVVLLIVGIIAAVTLPVVIPAISHRQVGETARIVQGGLIVARDSALRSNTPHGIRFLPDPTYPGVDPQSPTVIDPFRILASNRFIPIEQPPGYSSGRVFVDRTNGGLYSNFIDWPSIGNRIAQADTAALYIKSHVLLIGQSVQKPTGYGFSVPEEPTAWYWNVRLGDRIQVGGVGPFYTVVGPMHIDNPEKFVNVFTNPLRFVDTAGAEHFPEILFVVNGLDDDGDGYVDNGWDGVDNNNNGLVDEVLEWSEAEKWPGGLYTSGAAAPSDPLGLGSPYTIIRQPVPSPGARETVLPSNVVVDLTGSLLPNPPERSRLPVDPLSGSVDILVNPSGQVVPTTRYSSPTSFGNNAAFYHIWLAERSDLAAPNFTGTGATRTPTPLVTGKTFLLPMPLGRNYQTAAGVGDPNAYDALVATNPLLPYLKGEMRLLTLMPRSGNMIITDRPVFNVDNPSQPFHAPQLGEQGDAP